MARLRDVEGTPPRLPDSTPPDPVDLDRPEDPVAVVRENGVDALQPHLQEQAHPEAPVSFTGT